MSSMHDSPRYVLNRSAVFLLPKQPALDWLLRVDPNPMDITLEQLRQEPEVFLVPQSLEMHEQAVRWVNQNWKSFFEQFLDGWFTDESMWPQQRSRKIFNEWFDIHFSSMVFDMAKDELEVEDWGDGDD